MNQITTHCVKGDPETMNDPEPKHNMDDLFNMTRARARAKLNAFRLDSDPTQDTCNGTFAKEDQNHQQVFDSESDWATQTVDLPSSVYLEEELFHDDNFFRPEPREGDIPDPDYGTFLTFDASQKQDEFSNVTIQNAQPELMAVASSDMEVLGGLEEENAKALDLEPFSDTSSTVPLEVKTNDLVDLIDGELDDAALHNLVEDFDGLNDMVDGPVDEGLQALEPTAMPEVDQSSTGRDEDLVMSDYEFDEDIDWNMDLDTSELNLPTTTTDIEEDKPSPSIAIPQSAAPSSPIHVTPLPSSENIIVLDSSQPAVPPSTPPSEPPLTFATTTTPPFHTPIPPIARPAFPPPCLDRSPIIGLSSSILLRTCFRVGEALRVGMAAARESRNVIIELYARVLWSIRDSGSGVQTFEFGDLFHGRRPWLRACYEGWAGKEPWGYDAGVLVTGDEENYGVGEKKMARVLGRVERDEATKGWRMKVLNVWECDWEDVEAVRGVNC